MAVRRRARRLRGAHIAGRAGDILDIKLLAEVIGELLRGEPRENVGRAAGLERDDDTHRPARPALRPRAARGGRQGGRAHPQMQKSSTDHRASLARREIGGYGSSRNRFAPPLSGLHALGFEQPTHMDLEEFGMSRLATDWSRLRAWSANHDAELRLCVRSTTAGVLTLAAAQLLNLPIALWAVLTAVILTQISVGRSLKATMDYLTSTLGGAIYAGAIGALVPHNNHLAVFAGLAMAVLLAALYPRLSAAPFTAVMVFFGPTITHTGPIVAAFERVIEVAVGCIIGLFVSLVVLPARAHDLAIEAATQMLELMARFLPELFAGFTRDLDRPGLGDMQTRIGEALGRLDKTAAEARHERITRLGAGTAQRPLLRPMMRLRHDLVMIGRAAMTPLPEPFRSRLGPHLARVSGNAGEYLRVSAAALLAPRDLPSLDAIEAALDAYAAEFAALRREGFTRQLSDEAVERIFALGFALDQLRLHLRDLARCVAELAPPRSGAVRNVAASSEAARP